MSLNRSRDNWCYPQGQSSSWLIGRGPGYHLDAVNDRTDTDTQCTPSTILGDMREVGRGVKGDRLVAGVVTRHVTLAAIDAHVFVNNGHNLFGVIQVIVSSNPRQCLPYHVL